MLSEFYGKDKRLSGRVAFCFVFVRLNLSKVGSGGALCAIPTKIQPPSD